MRRETLQTELPGSDAPREGRRSSVVSRSSPTTTASWRLSREPAANASSQWSARALGVF